ncbi:hypothetical protein [Qaidamihabitans albus]|nr:hypothetical protein [Qaidamihabitans albus]
MTSLPLIVLAQPRCRDGRRLLAIEHDPRPRREMGADRSGIEKHRAAGRG